MTYIYTENSVFGPFAEVIESPTELLADGISYPKSVIGTYTLNSSPPRYEFTPATQARVIAHIDALLDSTAKSLGYDSIISACTYAACNVPRFASEGQALLNWRANCWATAHSVQGQLEAGTLRVNSEEDILAMIPPFPGVV